MSFVVYETLREKVSDYLRKEILHSKLLPGERVNELEIAGRLNISRGPIRESLRQLEQEGLVDYKRNRGCFVRNLSVEDVAEIFLLRSALENLSLKQCNGNYDSFFINDLENVLNKMRDCEAQGSIYEFVNLDQEFHALIANASKLKQLFRLWDSCTTLNFALFLSTQRTKFRLNKQYSRHKLIVDALKKGIWDEISEAITKHYMDNSALYDNF